MTQQFDALHRRTSRIVPERTFAQRRCQDLPAGPISTPSGGLGCTLVFPYYPNRGTGYTIPADTSVFVYDAVGNMLQANNRYARVKRTYLRNGAVKLDSCGFRKF